MFCPSCGHEVSEHAFVCPQCGHLTHCGEERLKSTKTPTAAPETPPSGCLYMPVMIALSLIFSGFIGIIGGIVGYFAFKTKHRMANAIILIVIGLLLVLGNRSDSLTFYNTTHQTAFWDVVYESTPIDRVAEAARAFYREYNRLPRDGVNLVPEFLPTAPCDKDGNDYSFTLAGDTQIKVFVQETGDDYFLPLAAVDSAQK